MLAKNQQGTEGLFCKATDDVAYVFKEYEYNYKNRTVII